VFMKTDLGNKHKEFCCFIAFLKKK